MVAYSFNTMFVEPMLAGTKIGTIRRLRNPPSRHARWGDELQLYTGLRTKHTRLVAYATCVGCTRIVLDLQENAVFDCGAAERILDLHAFAIADGFRSWTHLVDFWRRTHPGVARFEGARIVWGNTIRPAEAP